MNFKYKRVSLIIMLIVIGVLFKFLSWQRSADRSLPRSKNSDSLVANKKVDSVVIIESENLNRNISRTPSSETSTQKKPTEISKQASFADLINVLKTKTASANWMISVFEKENHKIQISGGQLKIDPQQAKTQIEELASEVIKITAPGLSISSQISDPIESDVLQTYKINLMQNNTAVIGAQITLVVNRELSEVAIIQTESVDLGVINNRVILTQNDISEIINLKYKNRNPQLRLNEQPKIYIKSPNIALYVWQVSVSLQNPVESYMEYVNAETGNIENSFRISIHEGTPKF